MTYITESITAQPHLKRRRTKPVRVIFIHSTRGGTASAAVDYSATKYWFKSPNNGSVAKGWGSCASRIIGPNGEHCVVMGDDEYPAYSGCYGYNGPPQEFCMDEVAISYEVAQPTASTPFTDDQYERLAIEVARDCVNHNIPPVMVDYRAGHFPPVIAGVTRHDLTANGIKLGKTDPGAEWDDVRFMSLLKAKLGQEEDMGLTPEEHSKLMNLWDWAQEQHDMLKGAGTPNMDGTSAEESVLGRLATLENKLDTMPTLAVDAAAIAKAVNDDLHERTAE
ncbi:hypothetical protein LCGC14_1346240 [marine sediment metagenome]|uniref:N-acetylmuramoyl-L-alanine amidase domain-containing protein n=1 Tax=marine sediment metagenome TaxID=412755 RepID=A0A0F9KCX5_9ZZZZ